MILTPPMLWSTKCAQAHALVRIRPVHRSSCFTPESGDQQPHTKAARVGDRAEQREQRPSRRSRLGLALSWGAGRAAAGTNVSSKPDATPVAWELDRGSCKLRSCRRRIDDIRPIG